MAIGYPPFLFQVVRQEMLARGFRVDFDAASLAQAQSAKGDIFPAGLRDLSSWLWSSIDNDESRDLDQIEYAVEEAGGVRLYVGIADVAATVAVGSPVDAGAQKNTTSIYTGVETFPMLPERFSTNLTSLVEGSKRAAIVIEMLVDASGAVSSSAVYPAVVFNHAQLTYHAVAQWLQKSAGNLPPSAVTTRMLAKINSSPELQKQLQLQDRAASALRAKRHEAGALSLQTGEFSPVLLDQGVLDLQTREPDVATRLIEDLMIASNQAVDEFLSKLGRPVLRRVVRTPKRWDRLVDLAKGHGATLPAEPDARALEAFLSAQFKADPQRFPDLSLAVVKLLGRGEYVVSMPGDDATPGHFALAVQHYSHSTAPNRRYPDLVTQRLLHSTFDKNNTAPELADLKTIATHCTEREDAANKVERFAHKCVAALALSRRIGETFEGYITGAGEKGTWVRLRVPPVEGRVEGNPAGLDVGDRVQVRLKSTDARRGFIDFDFVSRSSP